MLLFSLSTLSFAGKWSGSGFFINGNGFIATAGHVIESKHQLLIKVTWGQSTYYAIAIAADFTRDAGIIKIFTNEITPHLNLRLDGQIGMGTLSLGFPLARQIGYKMVAGPGILLDHFYTKDFEWQTSSQACPGNSGGPLVDKNINAIGIITTGWFNPFSPCSTMSGAVKASVLRILAHEYGIHTHLSTLMDRFRGRFSEWEQAAQAAKPSVVFIEVVEIIPTEQGEFANDTL